MSQVHIYFLIQTFIQGQRAYLVNTNLDYIPNLLITRTTKEEAYETAKKHTKLLVDSDDNNLFYFNTDTGSDSSIDHVLLRVDVSHESKIQEKDFNWVNEQCLDNLVEQLDVDEAKLFHNYQ